MQAERSCMPVVCLLLSDHAKCQAGTEHLPLPGYTMRFGSTAKVLAKCMLKYHRISEWATLAT